jgi:uncharacterized protein
VPVVVSDTSPVRCLSHVGQLDVLPALFGEVLVPPAVVQELANPRGRFAPLDVGMMPQLRVRRPADAGRVAQFAADAMLHPGESEALALAIEVGAAAVLIDEAVGRAAALRAGLTPIGVAGVLLRAKQNSLLPAVGPILDQIVSELRFFVAPELREYVLRQAGEWKDRP